MNVCLAGKPEGSRGEQPPSLSAHRGVFKASLTCPPHLKNVSLGLGPPRHITSFYEHQVMCAVGNLSSFFAFGARGSDNDGSLNAH